ncbi:MAG: integrating conjugative element protein [Planctomycetaceae bacterium]|nr:integrating conjugative element protein [Planctomycetaceae bacterium]
MKKFTLLFSLMGAFAFNTSEAVTIIYDSGNTYSIAPYVPGRVDSEVVRVVPNQNSAPFQLPIETPSMRPGRVTVTPMSLRYLQQPLFLVGSDPASQAWLEDKKQALTEINAVGLLIEAKDMSDVELMLSIAGDLRLIPASAQGFAEKLGLTYYPVLLSKDGWEQ